MYHLIIIIDINLKETLVEEIRAFLLEAQIKIESENTFDRKVEPFQKYKNNMATYFCAKVTCAADVLKNACSNARNNLTGILVLRHFKLSSEMEKNISNEVIELL